MFSEDMKSIFYQRLATSYPNRYIICGIDAVHKVIGGSSEDWGQLPHVISLVQVGGNPEDITDIQVVLRQMGVSSNYTVITDNNYVHMYVHNECEIHILHSVDVLNDTIFECTYVFEGGGGFEDYYTLVYPKFEFLMAIHLFGMTHQPTIDDFISLFLLLDSEVDSKDIYEELSRFYVMGNFERYTQEFECMRDQYEGYRQITAHSDKFPSFDTLVAYLCMFLKPFEGYRGIAFKGRWGKARTGFYGWADIAVLEEECKEWKR